MVIILTLVVIVAALAILVAQKPNEFRVMRSIVIHAPAEKIFPHIDNLHLWQAWSPWAKMDPEARTTFAGPDAGVSASMEWAGQKTGHGRMTNIESQPCRFVKFRLEFFKPMQAINTADFTLTEQEAATLVTWTMYGPNSLMGKIMSLFMNCEKMIGTQFNQGLNDLKAIAEQ